METDSTCNNSFWTREEDKAFENALAIYSGDIYPWEKIAAAVPGRTVDEIRKHFEILMSDVNAIDSGDVPLPQYADSLGKPRKRADHASSSRKRNQSKKRPSPSGRKRNQSGKRQCLPSRKKNQSGKRQSSSGCQEKPRRSDGEHKKGRLWTEQEHRLFLHGLEKYGKGDWRNISRHCIKTRTPTQVASHAQKFFKRMNAVPKGKKRMSIHDTTNLDDGKLLAQKMLITGQSSGVDGTSELNTRRYQNFGTVPINPISCPDTSWSDVSTAQQLSAEQIIGASGVGLIAHPMSNLHGISISQGPSTEQKVGASGCLIGPCMPNLHSISISKGPSTNMIRAADYGFISSHQGISVPQAPSTKQMTGAAEIGLVCDPMASHNHLPIHQAPTMEQMIGAAGVGVSMFTGQQSVPTFQAPIPEQVIAGGGASMVSGQQSLPTFQAPITEQVIADGGASMVSGQQSLPTFQAPIPEQVIADGGVDFSDPLIDSLQYISTPQGLPDSGEMIGAGVEDFIIDLENFLPEYDLSIFDSPAASQPILEPSTSAAAVPRCVPSPSPAMYGKDAPLYGAFVPDVPPNMANLIYPLPPH